VLLTWEDETSMDVGGRRETVLSALETARALTRPRGFESHTLRWRVAGGEFHPPALSEPCVNLSIYTAPII